MCVCVSMYACMHVCVGGGDWEGWNYGNYCLVIMIFLFFYLYIAVSHMAHFLCIRTLLVDIYVLLL